MNISRISTHLIHQQQARVKHNPLPGKKKAAKRRPGCEKDGKTGNSTPSAKVFIPCPAMPLPSFCLLRWFCLRCAVPYLNIISSRRGPLETILIGQPISFSRNST